MWVRRCLAVPAANAPYARQLCATVAGASGTGMWASLGSSPTGAAPATYYIDEGPVRDDFAGLLPFWTIDPLTQAKTLVSPGAAATVAALANAAGMVTTQAAVQALFDAVDVTGQAQEAAHARLGVIQIQAAL